MSNFIKKKISLKLLKTGFLANVNWLQAPGFDLLHYIYQNINSVTYLTICKTNANNTITRYFQVF